MDIVQTSNCTQVGEHKPFEAPLLAQNLLEQKWIRRHRDAVDFMVGSHGGHCVPLAEGRLKAAQHYGSQLPLTHMHRRGVGPALG